MRRRRATSRVSVTFLPTVDALTHHTNNSEFGGPPFNISDYQPAQTPSSTDPISAHVPLKFKQKFGRENLSIYPYY